ncbi:copper amine oxidase N-terminal domain-containing protein [Clostridium sp. Marseille-Q2269]|uniref:copper amine oxidase N-terminal domain-containing protein n=1 Tax=Clostridium sp. Marseille-Q2269 TaxID=2942205 RepID=UPI0020746A30|nr:copper amine oxidase N-terminal domain-containing protein [Clostridium sp. Marseille-Q2269]
MKIIFYTFIIFLSFSLIAFLLTTARFIYHHKYGKAVFKINKNKYKKSQRSKKEFLMTVSPFKDENDNVFLPLKYVANSLGMKLYYDEKRNMIINVMDKSIKANKEIIFIENSSKKLKRKIDDNIKIINNELMLPQSYIKDIFDINIEINNNTGEVVLR